MVVEFPLALLVPLLGAYALWRERPLARAAAYAGGVAAGVLPLVAFDLWAYGSLKPLPYEHAVVDPGRSGRP